MSDLTISMVKCATDTKTCDVRLHEVLDAIRTGGRWLRGQIEKIRVQFEAEMKKNGGDLQKAKLAVDPLKKALPAVTFSGRFSYRANDKLVQHSGGLCADLDSLGEELEKIREKLKTSPHLWMLFRSPTGNGLKAVFRVLADGAKHLGSYRAVENHVRELTGIQIDQKCKDPARLCFMSYDPQLYVNANAKEIDPLPEPEKPRADLRASAELPPDMPLRERIATQQLGELKYSAAKGGYFCKCPGEANHTNSTGEKHTIVYLDSVPTLDCQHESCKRIVEAFNAKLRSEIGKAERQARREAPRVEMQEAPEPPPPPPPYVPPPLDLLPQLLQKFVRIGAAANDVDTSFVFLPVLSELGACIGISRSVRIKEGWIQPPIVWTSVVAASGDGKDPGMRTAIRAQLLHEMKLKRENDKKNDEYEKKLAAWKATPPKKRTDVCPKKPADQVCWMDDATIEAVARRLNENARGILLAKAELSHWFASFDQYRDKGGSDVARWLQLYDGDLFAVDRVTGERCYRILNPRICIASGVQPDTLGRLLTPEYFERGLPARLFWAMPKRKGPRKYTKKVVSPELFAEVAELFSKLRSLEPDQIKTEQDEPEDDEEDEQEQKKQDRLTPKLLPLSPEAEKIFTAFYDEVGQIMYDAAPRVAAQWSKLIGGSARLALVGQLAHDPNAKEISGKIMTHAVALARWFGQEAERIYAQLAETPEQRARRELIEFIERRGGAVTDRDVYTNYSALKNNKPGTEQELTALVKAGLGSWEPVPTTEKGGRPARKFQLRRASASAQPTDSPSVAPSSADADSAGSQENEGVGGPSDGAAIDGSTAPENADADTSGSQEITGSGEPQSEVVSGDLRL